MPRTPWSSRSPRSTLLEDEAFAQRRAADARLRDTGAPKNGVEHREAVDIAAELKKAFDKFCAKPAPVG